MMKEILKIELKNKKQAAMIKELLSELDIKFESVFQEEERKAEKLYGKDFVKMVKEGREEYLRGECMEIKTDDLWK